MGENSDPAAVPANLAGAATGADDDWTGRTVGEFHILRSLGRGGMGQVYLAEQLSLKRKVAIKMLRPELAANRTALARFKSEAEAVARLSHGNIVQIYAVGEQDGTHFMALEYVEGRNLRDYLNRKGPPELTVCLSIMRQVASALQRAHEGGFIHRDIKPENILLTRKGEAKVTDFGLSRCFTENGQQVNLTQSGVAMGTPLYMSPEQVQGKSVDQRSDIYSFGVTCFSLLAGTTPFRGASAFDVAVQHVQNRPPELASLRPDLPPELCAMVHKMMAKDPAERHQSFKEVLREINQVRDALGSAATAPTLLNGAPSAAATELAPESAAAARSKWFSRLVVAAVLLGVFAGGVAARLLRHRLAAQSAGPVSEKPAPVVSEEESYLLQGSRLYADPNTSDERKLKDGLDAQIELAVYYFRNHRLGDVDSFCRELLERKYKAMPKGAEHPYRAFARLAQALAQAYRDQPQALEQLGKLIQRRDPLRPAVLLNMTVGGVPGELFDNPDLRRLIMDALNHLAADPSVHVDRYPVLEALRKPPTRPFRPRI